MNDFKKNTIHISLLKWYDQFGRKTLPWQTDMTPYRVWLSEIMLQQTQVTTVIPYYKQFMLSFPSINDLAAAPLDTVLQHWAGLGYYSRARNLHRTAQIITTEYHGKFPDSLALLQQLPGIGRSTAGAILAISMKKHATILDGNVKRVLTRLHAIQGWPGLSTVTKKLWTIAEHYTPKKRVAAYTQAIMDLGATICTRSKPRCPQCPLKETCAAFKLNCPTDFPHQKPKKSIPVRKICMLIIKNKNGEILFEKRPPTGIWGGLWSLPECAIDQNIEEWCKQNNLIINAQKIKSHSFRHTFSHFHLDIQPIYIESTSSADTVMQSPMLQWHSPNATIGLPAPVTKLLQR